ncbi:IS200/IS605 family transposase [Amaricoccus solimangrovi]|uniref:IS200/IS605 family transposase n=2 Tax=Pseudomonadati TaxID=3379134 RepID=A0A501W6L8_9RHOB|nr:IS200/IS605 family transposase [Amaricoccus solimangrovi]
MKEVKPKRWKTSSTSVYNIGYHLIWCPKFRRKVLSGHIEVRLRELLMEKAGELGLRIEKMEVMPEYVHLLVKASPADAPQFIVAQLKGYTSFKLRSEFPELKSKLPTLWTRSFYVESVGHLSEATVKKYIEDQKRQ